MPQQIAFLAIKKIVSKLHDVVMSQFAANQTEAFTQVKNRFPGYKRALSGTQPPNCDKCSRYSIIYNKYKFKYHIYNFLCICEWNSEACGKNIHGLCTFRGGYVQMIGSSHAFKYTVAPFLSLFFWVFLDRYLWPDTDRIVLEIFTNTCIPLWHFNLLLLDYGKCLDFEVMRFSLLLHVYKMNFENS